MSRGEQRPAENPERPQTDSARELNIDELDHVVGGQAALEQEAKSAQEQRRKIT